MNQASAQTIRKAAILVASLDEQQGRQLTGGLSASDADLLGQAVAELGPIDPEERLKVFQELRLGTSGESFLEEGVGLEEGVELDWSSTTTEKYGAQDQYLTKPSGTYQTQQLGMRPHAAHPTDRSLANRSKPFDFLGRHDTQAMAKKLLEEPPQIIAVVMSQLTADLAADLLREMPLTLQTEVLERLAQLHPADQQALEVVEDHLAGWIESHRQQQQRLSQGHEKVRQILARTSGRQRQEILDRLGHQNQTFAHGFEAPATSASRPGSDCNIELKPGAHPHRQDPNQVMAIARAQAGQTVEPSRPSGPSPANNPTAPPTGPAEARRIAPASTMTGASSPEANEPPKDLAGCDMEALNQVSNTMLLEALRQAEPQIAMLALAGAPPHLLDRILGQLPRRQGRRFRRLLHSLQPTRIRDLLAAQQRFVQLALGVESGEARVARNEQEGGVWSNFRPTRHPSRSTRKPKTWT